MENSIKDRIMSAADDYLRMNGLTAAELCRRAGVSASYYSVAAKGKYTYQDTEIKDVFFRKLASAIGMRLETSYWQHADTTQYVQIVNTLDEARERCEARMVLGETGCGKTYAIDRFCGANPVGVYRITVNDCDTLRDVLAELVKLLRIDTKAKNGSLLRVICETLRERAMRGERPILIFDEVENLKRTGIKAIKAVYDGVRYVVPVVLVGTPDFAVALQNLKNKGVKGMAQFIRRFKAGQTALAPIDRRYLDFMEQIKDEELRQLLSRIADNYGELHDYLERAMREADEQGEPLTVELFKEMYNIKTA